LGSEEEKKRGCLTINTKSGVLVAEKRGQSIGEWVSLKAKRVRA